MFQSTPPHGGRRVGSKRLSAGINLEFQSTPPHGGRPKTSKICQGIPSVVSIHAPARGATGCHCWPTSGHSETRVSIHAPARGATFNVPDSAPQGASVVSIHAPARGATRPLKTLAERSSCTWCFNPRPRTGGDLQAKGINARRGIGMFQSTPPHGGRPLFSRRICAVSPHCCFNPRPRTGGDGECPRYVHL